MGRDGNRSQSGKGEDELHSVVKDLVVKLCTADEFILKLTETITGIIEEKYNEKIAKLEEENQSIVRKLQQQEETIKSLVNHQKKQEQMGRSTNLRIYGVPEPSGPENLSKTMLAIFTTTMHLELDERSIEFCYRLNKKETHKSRPVLVKFSSNYYKNVVYKNKRSLKSTNIIIREDLTREQLNIVTEAVKKINGSGVVWTNYGQVYVKLNGQQNGRRISSLEDVAKLLT